MKAELLAQIVGAFQPDKGTHIEKLDKADPTYRQARTIEAAFTGGVEVLRSAFPNERIRALGSVIWDIFHHRYVSMALGPAVPTLSIGIFGRPDALQALVFAPHNWAEMTAKNPLMELGAIVLVGSQAVDFYNGRVLTDGSGVMMHRARSYEAEYIRSLGSAVKLTDYQQELLREFPHGFDTRLDYKRKPVAPMN